MTVEPVPSKRPRGKGRSSARLAAVQALYQMDIGQIGRDAVLTDGEGTLPVIDGEDARPTSADRGFFRAIVIGVVDDQRRLDRVVAEILEKDWPLYRIDSTLRAIFRAAAYELTARGDIPARVVIAEYVDVAGAFFGDEERRLANGVLDALARKVRPDDFAAPAEEA